jgi:hypothetical protein
MDEKMQEQQGVPPKKEAIGDVLKKYKEMRDEGNLPPAPPQSIDPDKVIADSLPTGNRDFNPKEFENTMSKETDPDLMMSYEVVKLPSKGLYYSHGISEVNVEYMTSKDEDLLTTPSLIENGTVLDVLLRRKIKTKGINPDDLLSGDRNAILLFLRSSSYGHEYSVQVTDPRTGKQFQTSVDLLKLRYKQPKELPDDNGCFNVEIPMRKKNVRFRLLTSGEENMLFKQAEAHKEAMNLEFNDYNTMKLKAHIVSIGEKTDPTYINKFVDVMPALDALTIRKKILEVSPDVDMDYKFTAPDGYTFNTQLSIGIDFFFPST